ncbi:U3 small nucleolar RNA-associated protein 18-like protein [Hibiscus syriacus]|uniref:U3 small nucleolar RNA-associated protein 18-like protein n=1 Tax=Hibiscus syriacus TaxID=106335 RepID=A0A6A2X6E1_HIBSY|nr:U3 small nucleolar RNA-associated protein 18-like protein [Hibiscus syriacus]
MIAFLGNEGYILLVSSKTKELIGTLKMNGTVRSLAFADNGNQLLSSGSDGEVYHWDLRMRTCFHKAVDEGCIKCTFLCASPNGRMFAAGSDSGIVNIYNSAEFFGKNSLKLIHVPSFTVYSNWPPLNKNLHYPRCLDFSPGGGFMAVGNVAGKVLLYKLHHYNHA